MVHCLLSGIVLSIYTVDKTDECDIIFSINYRKRKEPAVCRGLLVSLCFFRVKYVKNKHKHSSKNCKRRL